MDEKKGLHEKMTDKDNGLTHTQEVLYRHEFKKASAAEKGFYKEKNEQNKA